MGFYRSSCSPYDVQANQGGRFTFDTVKERYEKTIPLRGKRKEQNIRPINRRDRAWERIIKVSDNEYYVTYDAYQHRNHHNRAITYKVDDTMEWLTVHTPKATWGQTPTFELRPQEFRSSSTYWFYDFNMPVELNMVNYRANKYVRYNDKFYTVEKGDVVFQRKRGGSPTDWQPLVVHREFKHTLDRTKTKELRQHLKPFVDYYNVMSDIVEPKWGYSNLIYNAIVKDNKHRTITPQEALNLFKQTDNPPEEWFRLTEYLKRRATRSWYDLKTRTHNEHHEKSVAIYHIEQDLFKICKPCKEEAVELGKLSNDRYKAWYR